MNPETQGDFFRGVELALDSIDRVAGQTEFPSHRLEFDRRAWLIDDAYAFYRFYRGHSGGQSAVRDSDMQYLVKYAEEKGILGKLPSKNVTGEAARALFVRMPITGGVAGVLAENGSDADWHLVRTRTPTTTGQLPDLEVKSYRFGAKDAEPFEEFVAGQTLGLKDRPSGAPVLRRVEKTLRSDPKATRVNRWSAWVPIGRRSTGLVQGFLWKLVPGGTRVDELERVSAGWLQSEDLFLAYVFELNLRELVSVHGVRETNAVDLLCKKYHFLDGHHLKVASAENSASLGAIRVRTDALDPMHVPPDRLANLNAQSLLFELDTDAGAWPSHRVARALMRILEERSTATDIGVLWDGTEKFFEDGGNPDHDISGHDVHESGELAPLLAFLRVPGHWCGCMVAAGLKGLLGHSAAASIEGGSAPNLASALLLLRSVADVKMNLDSFCCPSPEYCSNWTKKSCGNRSVASASTVSYSCPVACGQKQRDGRCRTAQLMPKNLTSQQIFQDQSMKRARTSITKLREFFHLLNGNNPVLEATVNERNIEIDVSKELEALTASWDASLTYGTRVGTTVEAWSGLVWETRQGVQVPTSDTLRMYLQGKKVVLWSVR